MLGLLDKRLVFVAGKGGTGRTTIATALGLVAAATGRRTIVCEVSEDPRVSGLFRDQGVGYSELRVRPNLHAVAIDTRHALREYLTEQTGSERLTSMMVHNRIFDYFVAAAPGLKELITIGKVWELAQRERRTPGAAPYDLVILDAPASGHGLAMLKTPATYGQIANVGPIRRQAGRILDFIRDPALTGAVVVTLPQEMPVTETIEFGARMTEEAGVAVDAVVVNALLQERFSAEHAQRIDAALGVGGQQAAPALRAALSEYRRARSQRAQLRRLRRHVNPVVTLPYIWEPELGLDEVGRLAAELGRKL